MEKLITVPIGKKARDGRPMYGLIIDKTSFTSDTQVGGGEWGRGAQWICVTGKKTRAATMVVIRENTIFPSFGSKDSRYKGTSSSNTERNGRDNNIAMM
jgi:hypothetical protein